MGDGKNRAILFPQLLLLLLGVYVVVVYIITNRVDLGVEHITARDKVPYGGNVNERFKRRRIRLLSERQFKKISGRRVKEKQLPSLLEGRKSE